ncbi:hypothetical protein OPV22_019848 [Ensete ventricosum]|uniref:Uncharacterized protein n=1 Tax=Ensete ventricosum TaxID=4639 RepID=A0AAV8P992_ENSVE|nr:hypothetical protein OPV22_019848 [Ensete ventricosum]
MSLVRCGGSRQEREGRRRPRRWLTRQTRLVVYPQPRGARTLSCLVQCFTQRRHGRRHGEEGEGSTSMEVAGIEMPQGPQAAQSHARSRPATAASDEEDDNGGVEAARGAKENGIDAADLTTFLADISAAYESQQDIQLMRFADFFARFFASVSAPQFPWVNMFKESPVAKIAAIPLCHISDSVYKTSSATKASEKSVQQTPSSNQVAIFVVSAMALRWKSDALLSLLSKLRDNPWYQGQKKLPFIVWVIAQASLGDRVVGIMRKALCSESFDWEKLCVVFESLQSS